MTNPTHQQSNVLRRFLIGMMVWLAVGGQTSATANGTERKELKMTAKEMTLWQVIDQLGNRLPLRREGIEQLFEVKLSKLESSNQYVTFWDGVGGALLNGMRVSRIVLAVRNEDKQDPGMLTLNVSEACSKLDEIKTRYGDLDMVGAPRGRSENEETSYEAKTSWGRLVFGFAERNPGCLSSVGIDPKK